MVVDGFNPGEIDEHENNIAVDKKSRDIEESGYEGSKSGEP
jgi:hypothetical protein